MWRSSLKKPFSRDTKCCTYYPFLSNYLIGGALASGEFKTVQILKELILNRQWALPIGFVAPPTYQIKFLNKTVDDFGRRNDLLCPFYSSGQCMVWAWRDSQCSTYFCGYDDSFGETHWLKKQFDLYEVEKYLSQSCMLQKGFLLDEVEFNLSWIKLTNESKYPSGYQIEATLWAKFWQHYQDQIEQYYIECYRWVIDNKVKLREEIEGVLTHELR